MTNWKIVSYIFPLLTICYGFLNIEELTDAKYALDIVNSPINELELPENSVDGLKLASRHGQNYYCKLPFIAEKLVEKEEEKIPKNTPVESLLEPMRRETCLKTMKGWWTYEFCYGKYVKQYHSEDDVPQGDITYLGYYQSDFDWNQGDESTTRLRRHKINRYHSQTYVNGTTCDVINHKRDTEIRYQCDDSSPDTYIARVDEPSTCSYIITIHTPYVCSHPYTKPLLNLKPVEITCRPLLAPDDYIKFKEMEAAAAIRAAELELEQQKEIAKKDEEKHAKANDVEQMFHEQMVSMLDVLMPGGIGKKNQKTESTEKKELLDQKSQSPETEAIKKAEDAEAVKMIERFVVEERLQKMDPFKQKLLVMNVVSLTKKYKHLPTADFARKIEKYVSEFVGVVEDILQSDFDMNEVTNTLADSLTNQLFKEIANMPDELNQEKDEKKDEQPKKSPSVHLKIHNIGKLEDFDKLKAEDLVDKPRGDDDSEIDPSWKKLEDDISKSLEEAGFQSTDNHIEIRIVTNSENLGDVITLSTEEGERFRQTLLELVAGGSAMTNEVKKQKSLHDNYNLVWKKGDSGFTSLSTFDEDNKDDLEDQVRSPKL